MSETTDDPMVLQQFLNDVCDLAFQRANEYETYRWNGAKRAFQSTFVECVVEYPDGCAAAKRSFVEACGLEEFLPRVIVEFSGQVEYNYGEGYDNGAEEDMEYLESHVRDVLERAVRDLHATDYDLSVDSI